MFDFPSKLFILDMKECKQLFLKTDPQNQFSEFIAVQNEKQSLGLQLLFVTLQEHLSINEEIKTLNFLQA